MPESLAEWLAYIERLHPNSIEMGLARIERVRQAIGINLDANIITIAGTNGKGSTAAMLESVYLEAGYSVGCYASPHFLHYNERLRINRQTVDDAAFCQAFSVVERARQSVGVALTYFEFGTLAAAWQLAQADVAVCLLEVGLGGRLDAVNIFDADCAIVTNIALDHQDFLGDTRALIGTEKAGVFRQGKPAICGDDDPPNTLIEYAKAIGASFKTIGTDFTISRQGGTYCFVNHTSAKKDGRYLLPAIGLAGEFQANNAASALMAIDCMQSALPVKASAVRDGIQKVRLPGRFEVVSAPTLPTIIYDVAHNPNAAEALATNLANSASEHAGPTVAVFSMLHNKDWEGVIAPLQPYIDHWFIAPINHARSASIDALQQAVMSSHPSANIVVADSLSVAMHAILESSEKYDLNDKNGRILVFGSFFTVSEVKSFIQEYMGV